jgi:hypothetical protein
MLEPCFLRTYAALCEELYRGSNIQGYHWRHEVRKNYHRQRSNVPRGTVLSVTLFLIAISKMANKTKEPHNDRPGPRRNQTILSQRLDKEEMRTRMVGILGYGNHQMLQAHNNMQAALNRVAEWSKANGCRVSHENTKAIHICRMRLKLANHPYPTIRILALARFIGVELRYSDIDHCNQLSGSHHSNAAPVFVKFV